MVDGRRLLEALWTGRGRRARAARALLAPAEAIYRVVVTARGALYDRRVFRAEDFSIPIVSIGNLTVGGTGKTPVAAWIASRLVAKGVTPGIVLRGYGGDEIIVHQRLNEGVPVVASADRVRGIREAIAQGVDAVVLDDAFQHRRAARDSDVVLVNA
ncbi:MAG TPA: tetraacyldisaccharide 4'-kinase, partial [Gemmatimonadaceae bacterium]|nr:tetraacyldisaccharide 4'-kinase [Gemmatimonadaceae bacterium]